MPAVSTFVTCSITPRPGPCEFLRGIDARRHTHAGFVRPRISQIVSEILIVSFGSAMVTPAYKGLFTIICRCYPTTLLELSNSGSLRIERLTRSRYFLNSNLVDSGRISARFPALLQYTGQHASPEFSINKTMCGSKEDFGQWEDSPADNDRNELTRALLKHVLNESSVVEIVGEAGDQVLCRDHQRTNAGRGSYRRRSPIGRLQSACRDPFRFPMVRVIELSALDKAVLSKMIGLPPEHPGRSAFDAAIMSFSPGSS